MTEVANKKSLENDRVIVWELELAPGQLTGVHRHEYDYYERPPPTTPRT